MSRYRNILAAIVATCCLAVHAGYFGAGTNRNATAVTYGTNAVTAIYSGSNLVWGGVSYVMADGGLVTTNGDYIVHVFSNSASFAVSSPGLASFVVVGGGGNGGYGNAGGGGGGGGVVSSNSVNFAMGTYAVTVGLGAPAGSSGVYSNGHPSVIADMAYAYGGGAGSGLFTNSGFFGASGGGGGAGGGENGGGSISGQGNNGGRGAVSYPDICGGGGGAGTAGQLGTAGAGLEIPIVSESLFFGGGGGGRGTTGAVYVGGAGGGGNGGNNSTAATSGISGTGGGGGGGSGNVAPYAGGAGGKGYVAIWYRYK